MSSSLDQIIAQLQAAGLRSQDLMPARYRREPNEAYPLDGLCFVLSQALFCVFPDAFSGWDVAFEEGGGHVFLRDASGAVLDLVSYPTLLLDRADYDAGMPLRWRPRLPTQRTKTLLARAGVTLPAAHAGSARVRRGTRKRRVQGTV